MTSLMDKYRHGHTDTQTHRHTDTRTPRQGKCTKELRKEATNDVFGKGGKLGDIGKTGFEGRGD